MPKKVLTIAGSDTLSGGGLQADLATFSEYGLVGFTAITSIVTVVEEEFLIHAVDLSLLEEQLQTIAELPKMSGIKLGLLPTVEMIELVGRFLMENPEIPVVVDPVLVFKETSEVQVEHVREAMKKFIFPYAKVMTPNLVEAQILANVPKMTTVEEMKRAAEILFSFGTQNIVIKGGARIKGNLAIDIVYNGKEFTEFRSEKLQTTTNNGAGCTFASAIISNLVLGAEVNEAVEKAKEFVYAGIRSGVPLSKTLGNVWQGAKRQASE
ncbi:MAG: bifunctional hydroxymethylpyrimidine kinase/phosphomethylpyrimidine kinase [Lactobacillales bacterium]|jgi:pyridoxine kinase|nr:bifunctional hydroxymethylpyrimidine kinase/phosphomethylpyrimidine kinase [Lactobacillales bacterium]